MKKITTVFVLICFSVFGFGQIKPNSDQDYIKKSLTAFFQNIKSNNIDKAVNTIYPKFFSVVNKEQTTSLMNMTYNNPIVKLNILQIVFNKIEKPQLIDGEYFSLVKYNLKLKIDVSSMNEEFRKNVNQVLVSKYGKDRVAFDKKTNIYTVSANMKACAVSTDKKSWKYVIVEKEYQNQLKKVLPEKILSKI